MKYYLYLNLRDLLLKYEKHKYFISYSIEVHDLLNVNPLQNVLVRNGRKYPWWCTISVCGMECCFVANHCFEAN